MTLKEFEMHRPKLARSLLSFLFDSGEYSVEEVTPEYSSNILFRAEVRTQDGLSYVVCVSPDHPMAFHEEEAPGEPTWWWQADLGS